MKKQLLIQKIWSTQTKISSSRLCFYCSSKNSGEKQSKAEVIPLATCCCWQQLFSFVDLMKNFLFELKNVKKLECNIRIIAEAWCWWSLLAAAATNGSHCMGRASSKQQRGHAQISIITRPQKSKQRASCKFHQPQIYSIAHLRRSSIASQHEVNIKSPNIRKRKALKMRCSSTWWMFFFPSFIRRFQLMLNDAVVALNWTWKLSCYGSAGWAREWREKKNVNN